MLELLEGLALGCAGGLEFFHFLAQFLPFDQGLFEVLTGLALEFDVLIELPCEQDVIFLELVALSF